jgi:hypothetical protein
MGLQVELAVYELVVNYALRQGHSELDRPSRLAALANAGEIFASRFAAGTLPKHLYELFYFRLAIECAHASGPRFEVEPYELLSLDEYTDRAPLPERGDIVSPLQGGLDDDTILHIDETIREYIALASPSTSADEAVVISSDDEDPPVVRGRGRGRP